MENWGRISAVVLGIAFLLFLVLSKSNHPTVVHVARPDAVGEKSEASRALSLVVEPNGQATPSEPIKTAQAEATAASGAAIGTASEREASGDKPQGEAPVDAGSDLEEKATDAGEEKELTVQRHWKPYNGSFYIHWKLVRHRELERNIAGSDLKKVYLDHHRFGTEENAGSAHAGEACRGAVCPDFEYCYTGFRDVGACWQAPIEDSDIVLGKAPQNCPNLTRTCGHTADLQPHERWTSQVFVLHNVYVNIAGQVFNSTHFFDHNSCAGDHPFDHATGTAVHRFRELVSLVDWFAWDAKTNLLTLLPLLVSLERVLPFMKGIPVAFGHRVGHMKSQLQKMQTIGLQDLLGLELDAMNAQILKDDQLFYADKLILPLHQRCGKPSRAMWQHLRSRHLLPIDGLPMYSPDYSPRNRDSEVPTTFDIDDWIVVLGVRKVKKPLIAALKLDRFLRRFLPEERVVTYVEGSLSMPRRKELLNRAKLLIAVHDDILADMVFMPPGSLVLEIRPRSAPDPTYHHLAEVCGHEYYLMLAEGKRGGPLRMKRPFMLYSLVEELAKKLAPAAADAADASAASSAASKAAATS